MWVIVIVYIKEKYNMKSDFIYDKKVLNSDIFITSVTGDFLVSHIKDLLSPACSRMP